MENMPLKEQFDLEANVLLHEEDNAFATNTFGWIVQIFIWVTTFILIFSFITLDSLFTKIIFIIIWLISYITYTMMAFHNYLYHYLMNIDSMISLESYLNMIFSQPGEILFKVQCYHYEKKNISFKNTKGYDQNCTQLQKVITFEDSSPFNYFSCKDISGLLSLQSILSSRKAFVMLNLNYEINFADSISYSDYLNQKQYFYSKHMKKDSCIECSETEGIHNVEIKERLVKLNDDNYILVNIYMFYFFTFILPFIKPYSMYVESLCLKEKYRIKKVLSTRYNLDDPQYKGYYENMEPILSIRNDQLIRFDTNATSIINENCDMNAPSERELQDASKYEPMIKQYNKMSTISHRERCQDRPRAHPNNISVDYPTKKRESFSKYVPIRSFSTLELKN